MYLKQIKLWIHNINFNTKNSFYIIMVIIQKVKKGIIKMQYIVLDLEWNQCPEGKEKENKRLPFEIIEIGAMKLNEEYQVISNYHSLIKPAIYQEIHPKTKEIIHLEMEDLEKEREFKIVAEEFLEWCGEDYQFATWGSMDLTEFQRNMYYFGVEKALQKPLFYFDIQKLFSIQFLDGKSRISLESAVEFLQLEKGEEFHRADADTYYTVEIIKTMDMDKLKKNFSVDYYHNPKTKLEELHLTYETYYKYVSREFDTKEEAMEDKTVTATRCYLCNKTLKKKIRWFSNNSHIYYCTMFCEEHGWLKGKIRMKKSEDGKIFVVKTIKLTTIEEIEKIKHLQEEMRRKRRLKRLQELRKM